MRVFPIVLTLFTCLLSVGGHADPVLRGSPASLVKQNLEADKGNLTRIADSHELQSFVERGLLVKIPEKNGIKIDPRLNRQFWVVRPWTAVFLSDLGKKFQKKFKTHLQVNSATRTIEHQEHIAKHNKNAAPTEGDTRSSHLTGASIDIAKKPLTHEQKKWLRKELRELEQDDLIEATEEHYQAVFHVMVFPRYDEKTIHTALR